MRSLIPHLLFALLLAGPVLAKSPVGNSLPADLEEDVLGKPKAKPAEANVEAVNDPEDDEDAPKPTIFNDLTVPPMKKLTGKGFSEETKAGYWFVKYFSPYCPHCIAIAPTWQTLYEFYYTSKPFTSSHKPADATKSPNPFQVYYNFRFGSLDCTVWSDICNEHDIVAFPMFVLYKDGQEVKRFSKKKNMEGLATFLEEVLETIKPGSRPVNGVKLPEPGETSIDADAEPDVPAAKDEDTVGGAAAGQAHNVMASSVSSALRTTATLVANKNKPASIPNPGGASISLTQESFQKLVTTSQDPWLIKFYAPWCHHCQALAPNWHQMAKELHGKLNIGEVNCDTESRLCKDVGVRAYPTIHFFRGGERVEYEGLRGLGDLVSFAKNTMDVGMGVRYVDATTFKEMEENEEVIFVYFYDHATTSEDFEALERLTLSLIGHAKLVKTDSAALSDHYKIHTWPRLIVSRDGRATYYNALSPQDMRDFRRVLNWMQSVWLPIVPELTASNAREIMEGRIVVLGILSRERPDDFVLDKREIKNAALEWMDKETQAFQLERQELRDAKQLRIEEAEDRNDQRALRQAKVIRIQISEAERKQVGFAWADGVFWERWLRTTYGIEVRDGEKVIINDEDNKRYWDTTASGAPIVPSRTSILETLPKVLADPPKLTPKYTANIVQQWFFQTKKAAKAHPHMTLSLLVFALLFSANWGRKYIRRSKGPLGYFQLDGKEVLSSVNGIGKVD